MTQKDQQSNHNTKDTTTTPKRRRRRRKKPTIIFIRHGCSEANEFMDQPGNRWGDDTFTDDVSLRDARLSNKGREQAQSLGRRLHTLLKDCTNSYTTAGNTADKGEEQEQERLLKYHLNSIDLVVTSPLTRTIQTFNHAFYTSGSSSSSLQRKEEDKNDENDTNYNLMKILNNNNVKIMAHPLATERVYTASDTGRPIPELQVEFPHVDFHSAFHHEQHSREDELRTLSWWYTHDNYNNDYTTTTDISKDDDTTYYEEWRPYGNGQWYGVPGEPKDTFHQRMMKLYDWLQSQGHPFEEEEERGGGEEDMNDDNEEEERFTIVLVTHWGVIRWFTGEDVENCDVRVVDLEKHVVVGR